MHINVDVWRKAESLYSVHYGHRRDEWSHARLRHQSWDRPCLPHRPLLALRIAKCLICRMLSTTKRFHVKVDKRRTASIDSACLGCMLRSTWTEKSRVSLLQRIQHIRPARVRRLLQVLPCAHCGSFHSKRVRLCGPDLCPHRMRTESPLCGARKCPAILMSLRLLVRYMDSIRLPPVRSTG